MQITKDQALSLARTRFWEDMCDHDIVMFQLFEPMLCMDFSEFHRAIESCLGRSVFLHEFELNIEGIESEFLDGREAPTLDEIIELIPEEKRLVVQI